MKLETLKLIVLFINILWHSLSLLASFALASTLPDCRELPHRMFSFCLNNRRSSSLDSEFVGIFTREFVFLANKRWLYLVLWAFVVVLSKVLFSFFWFVLFLTGNQTQDFSMLGHSYWVSSRILFFKAINLSLPIYW